MDAPLGMVVDKFGLKERMMFRCSSTLTSYYPLVARVHGRSIRWRPVTNLGAVTAVRLRTRTALTLSRRVFYLF